MQISNVYVQSGAAEWARRATAEGSSNVKKENLSKTEGKTPSAKVSISANAGNSAEALVSARATALPEVREEKIAVARERIESGYYNTPEFSRELAARLVDE
jgi:anti-sigma28 factor (negative regulator of flagellin synthesis)